MSPSTDDLESRLPPKRLMSSSNRFQQPLPTRKPAHNGFDAEVEDMWWPNVRRKQRQRISAGDVDESACRTVPTEYYSRYALLKRESPNYILPPTSTSQRGSMPVFTFRPGTTVSPMRPTWPSRAHDGSTTHHKNTQDTVSTTSTASGGTVTKTACDIDVHHS